MIKDTADRLNIPTTILSSFFDRAGDTAFEYVPPGFVKSPESLSFTIPLPPKLDHKLRTLSFPEIRT